VKQLNIKKIFGFLENWRVLFGIVVLIIMLVVAIFAPVIAPYNPLDIDILNRLRAPSVQHLFGTDSFGRDVFSRVIWGTRISLLVGFSTTLLVGFFGSLIGLITGYFEKKTRVFMRILDGIMAFPAILLGLALMAILGPSTMNVILAISIVFAPRTGRIVRSCVLSVREVDFVEAARSIGNTHWRIMYKHIFPNVVSPLIIQLSGTFARAILTEAALSFLGVGQPPPMPSLGSILSEGRNVILQSPWITFFSGFAIFIIVFALNILGDGLRDELDPKFQG